MYLYVPLVLSLHNKQAPSFGLKYHQHVYSLSEIEGWKHATVGSQAKCHVRVSKQSCKQANRLILWGVRSTTKKKILDFFYFFSPKKNLKNMI